MPHSLTLVALRGLGPIRPGDDLAVPLAAALKDERAGERDVLVLAQKIVSKAEDRYVDLARVTPSPRAIELARRTEKDPRLVELILEESRRVVRYRPGVLIVEHRLGFVMANAGIDRSNVDPAAGAEPVLLLPRDPDGSAARLRQRLHGALGAAPAIIISDSFGRAWRRGTTGVAIGVAGLPALADLRGRADLHGRTLRVSEVGLADEIAAASSLLMGQADEAQPAVLVRGLEWQGAPTPASALLRDAAEDLFPVSVVALSGGVGGAKLALGLDRVLPRGDLLVVANTGDDFAHLGLAISPDLDTLLYTLAGLDNPETGWGRRDESWNFMAALEELGGATWFRLGDRDLATHVERTRRLGAGETLSAVTDDFRRRLGIATRIVPMSDDPVRTRVRTSEGVLDFQDYFVRRGAAPKVLAVDFAGAERARANPVLVGALADPDLRAVVICPSNPFISIEPILAVPGIRAALAATRAPVVAVTPIIAGQAVKGPAAKMMRELGLDPGPAAVAARYGDLIDLFIADRRDAAAAAALPVRCVTAETLMLMLDDRMALARTVLAAADGARR